MELPISDAIMKSEARTERLVSDIDNDQVNK